MVPLTLRAHRLGIDTYRQPVVYMRADCPVCRAEGFGAHTQLTVVGPERRIAATLHVVVSDVLTMEQVGLSEEAWRLLDVEEGAVLRFEHAPPLDSFAHVRAKMFGHRLDAAACAEIARDLRAGAWADVHTAAFLAACAGNHLDVGEMNALTRAMVDVGERLAWPGGYVLDKHCVGGLPGNRTTPIVVAIVAAAGLMIPKTSSRAITSPAGTADVVDTFSNAGLSLAEMRRVVEREGGCLAWGGSVDLSPVDDVLVRVERALDIDSQGQLVASVLSKKVAAGSTHVVVDIPVGPTAKVRSTEAAASLARDLGEVGRALGLDVESVLSDGSQPVGRGVGPALEARDVLAVLRREEGAPTDLRDRALVLAGRLLEIGGKAQPGHGAVAARRLLDDGRAWSKLHAIAEAQGGFREPPTAPFRADVVAAHAGTVIGIDNRKLSRVAKLAGAPADPAAGLWMAVRLGESVVAGQPLFAIHAESLGELDWALEHVRNDGIVTVGEPGEAKPEGHRA